MTREEIKEGFEELDDTLFDAIIDSCKILVSEGVPMYNWDRDTVSERLEKVLNEWYCL